MLAFRDLAPGCQREPIALTWSLQLLGGGTLCLYCATTVCPKKLSGYITGGQGVFRVYRNSNYKFYLTVTLSLLVFTCRGKNFDYLFFFTYVFSLFCCFIQLFFFSDQVEWEEKNAKKIWFEEEGLQQSFCGVMTFKETMTRISKMADKNGQPT